MQYRTIVIALMIRFTVVLPVHVTAFSQMMEKLINTIAMDATLTTWPVETFLGLRKDYYI